MPRHRVSTLTPSGNQPKIKVESLLSLQSQVPLPVFSKSVASLSDLARSLLAPCDTMASSVSYETTARGYKVVYDAPADFFGSDHCASCAAGGDAVLMDGGECPRYGCFQNYQCYECCDQERAEAREETPAPDLLEPVPGSEEEISGVHIVTLRDGRKVLSGNTFRFREQIKAASLAASGLAAGWDAAEKTWTVAAGTDLSWLRPAPGAPKKVRLPFRGACCADARYEFDPVCPQGPMLIVCGMHGSRRDSYEGS